MNLKKRPILLCLDLEAGSEELARYAASYTKQSGQPLHVLHIIPQSSSEEEDAARERLKKLADNTLAGVKIEALVAQRGAIEEQIVNFITEKDLDIVILGHRHKAKRERVYVGSTVRTVISLAPGPVLVIPIDTKVEATLRVDPFRGETS
jgi:nucleotide-binding universal stress UspA family protein